jgi:cation transport protein ChaC
MTDLDSPKPTTAPEPPPFIWPPADRPGADLWVFGYGSLLWRPGFPHEEVRPAVLHGYHRAFCMWSYHYRGTRARPGLVLGLDSGGACRGRAFRVAPADVQDVRRYLWDREMITAMYRERIVPVRLPDDGARVLALTYTVDHGHEQYAGKLSLDEQAAIIAAAHGDNGANVEYLMQTVDHLDELGIGDGPLHALRSMLGSDKP